MCPELESKLRQAEEKRANIYCEIWCRRIEDGISKDLRIKACCRNVSYNLL